MKLDFSNLYFAVKWIPTEHTMESELDGIEETILVKKIETEYGIPGYQELKTDKVYYYERDLFENNYQVYGHTRILSLHNLKKFRFGLSLLAENRAIRPIIKDYKKYNK